MKTKHMGVEMARQHFSKQHPIRCALFGHKTSGVLVEGHKFECLRCGGMWPFTGRHHQSIYEWLVLWPISPFRRSLRDWRFRRWNKKNCPKVGWV